MAGQEKSTNPPEGVWPHFDEESIEAVASVLRSGRVNYWTGDLGRKFEAEFAEHCGSRRAIAVANGTLALELALYALGVGPGDEVIVPSRTFIATASSVVARGARPVCADIDRDSQNLCARTAAPLITPKTKAMIAVHLAGWPCDMDPLLELARERGVSVVEDCAQAHGARYKGRPVGSLGDVGAFSFCQDKIMSTGGEGGMMVTNNEELWDRAWRYKDHGKTPEAFYSPQPPSTQFRWLHEGFGSNFRMTEMQSAIGRLQLVRLPQWSAKRRDNAATLEKACARLPVLRTPKPGPDERHAFYKFYTFIRPERLASGWDRDRILRELRAAGVPCMAGSCSEIYREAAFPLAWRPPVRLPGAKELGETSLMLPVHPTLSRETVNGFADGLSEVLTRAGGGSRIQSRAA